MGGIFNKLWQTVQHDHAGRRFQDRYEAAREARKDGSWRRRAVRVFRLLVALVAFVIGVFLMVLPGPAILFFLIAGGLLAAESIYVARLLDWSEVKLRAGWAWVQRLSQVGKFVLAGLVVFLGTGLAYASYRLLTR